MPSRQQILRAYSAPLLAGDVSPFSVRAPFLEHDYFQIFSTEGVLSTVLSTCYASYGRRDCGAKLEVIFESSTEVSCWYLLEINVISSSDYRRTGRELSLISAYLPQMALMMVRFGKESTLWFVRQTYRFTYVLPPWNEI